MIGDVAKISVARWRCGVSRRPRNETIAEPNFIQKYGDDLRARGERFTPMEYIGIVAAVAFHRNGKLTTATESWRGGGGSALVVRPQNPRPALAGRVLGR